MKVHFTGIGRSRATWDAEVESERGIVQEIIRKRVLMSKDVWIEMDDDGSGGSVFAGMREVGGFTIEVEESKP